MPELTAQKVRELLDYEPETGVFRRLVNRRGRGAKRGAIAGASGRDGRRRICIDRKSYMAARLAFLWMTGEWPQRLVDHKDGDPSNDRWDNLRQATHSQNGANSRGRSASSGYKGVSWHKEFKCYVARIKVGYQMINLGRFDTAENAHAAYRIAANDRFGDFARTS